MESLHRALKARKEAATLAFLMEISSHLLKVLSHYKYLLINLTTVFDKLKLAHIAFPAVVVVESVTPLITKKDTLL